MFGIFLFKIKILLFEFLEHLPYPVLLEKETFCRKSCYLFSVFDALMTHGKFCTFPYVYMKQETFRHSVNQAAFSNDL